MTSTMRFNDLPDDCLLLVFDRLPAAQLFKMLAVNKRINRLAPSKMRTKVKVIQLNAFPTSVCKHLASDSPDKMLVLAKMFQYSVWEEIFLKPQDEASFFDLFSKCSSVTSIDFGQLTVNEHLLQEVISRCSELACIKMKESVFNEDEWNRVLDLVGHQLVHLAVKWKTSKAVAEQEEVPFTEARMLEMVVAKCPNIKQLDWNGSWTFGTVAVLKTVPRSCWIRFVCDIMERNQIDPYQDVVDELHVSNLWGWLSRDPVERLSTLSLDFIRWRFDRDLVSLKKLDVSRITRARALWLGDAGPLRSTPKYFARYFDFDVLTLGEFPNLEEFCFNVNFEIYEGDFKYLFYTMRSISKLTIVCDGEREPVDMFLPRLPSSSIHVLKNLETINLCFRRVPSNWQPKSFLDYFKQYVVGDETRVVKSLKKVVIEVKCCLSNQPNRELEEAVKQMKQELMQKQNRVEIEVNIENEISDYDYYY